jgi:hypothetical protein
MKALIKLAEQQVAEWQRWIDNANVMKGDPVLLAKTMQRVARWRAAIAAAKGGKL